MITFGKVSMWHEGCCLWCRICRKTKKCMGYSHYRNIICSVSFFDEINNVILLIEALVIKPIRLINVFALVATT